MKPFQKIISPFVAITLAVWAIVLTPTPTIAGKALASPFAGDWCYSDGWFAGGTMTISSRGSVSGGYGEDLGANYSISGSISDVGEVTLIYQTSGMKRRGSTKTTVTGNAYLQDFDTLVLELQFDYGVTTQIWYRCSL